MYNKYHIWFGTVEDLMVKQWLNKQIFSCQYNKKICDIHDSDKHSQYSAALTAQPEQIGITAEIINHTSTLCLNTHKHTARQLISASKATDSNSPVLVWRLSLKYFQPWHQAVSLSRAQGSIMIFHPPFYSIK